MKNGGLSKGKENGKKRPIRERQKDLTRSTILEALGQTLIEEGIHNFSVQSVADRAGVSHRTVYRHFPNREALLEGLGEEIESLSTGMQAPKAITDFEQGVSTTFDFLEEHREMTIPFLQLAVTSGFRAKLTRMRDNATLEIVQEIAPELTPQEQKEGAVLIRFLASSVAWMIFKTQFGLTTDEAVRIVQSTVSIVHKDLIRRNRAAAKLKS